MNQLQLYTVVSFLLCSAIAGFLAQVCYLPLLWIVLLASLNILSLFNLSIPGIEQYQDYIVVAIWMSLFGAGSRLVAQSYAKTLQLLKKTEADNKALSHRNKTISLFVKPSILKEIEIGEDPTAFSPRNVEKTVLLCDLRGFTPLSQSKKGEELHEVVNRYFSIIMGPIFKNNGEIDKLGGDSVLAIFNNSKEAIQAAVELRLSLQKANKDLIESGQDRFRNVICLSTGESIEGNFGSSNHKLDRTLVGWPVNVCSRIEPIAKTYGLEIIATENVLMSVPDYAFTRLIDYVKVRGYDKLIKLYEIFEHQPANVQEYKIKTRELLEKALSIYFENKGIKDATRLFNAIKEQMPHHVHNKNEYMDNMIEYYLYRCNQWFDSPEKWANRVDAWEGCHDFGKESLPHDWASKKDWVPIIPQLYPK